MVTSYSFIQILINLYDEYVKNEFELQKLKSYTTLDDPKIEDYCFRCVANKLWLDRELKKSKLKQMIENITGIIDLSALDDYKKDYNGNYVIEKMIYKNPTIIDQNAFNNQADKILKSSFIQNIDNESIAINNGNFGLTTGSIYMFKDNYHSSCFYYSRNNILTIKSSSKITDYRLYELLNSQIDKSKLNDWQQRIIELNNNQSQEIIYPQILRRCHRLNLSIDKRENKVLLKQI